MHITVAVIHSPDEDIHDVLAPFQENNMGDCPSEYMEFMNGADEYSEEYETRENEYIVSPDNIKYVPWASEVQQYKNPEWENNKDLPRFNLPEGWAFKNVPVKEVYPTLNDYLEKYHELEFNEEQQVYGYWTNPNSHWDWYQIGGRWKDYLKLKPDAEPFMSGEASLLSLKDLHEDKEKLKVTEWGKADSALIKDIDFEGMAKEDLERAEKNWRNYEEKLASLKEGETFNAYWDFGIEKDETKEQYLARHIGFNTWAILEDGDWEERGWGDEPNDLNFAQRIERWKKERPDDVITIVDCHS